jgi:outer membrane immunogenic protein
MRLFVALAAVAVAVPALAADYPASPGPAPVLRGALPGVQASQDWSGFYFGGNVGYANATNAISNAGLDPLLESLVTGTAIGADMRRRSLVYTGRNQSGVMTFGGFAGYNFQSDEMVFGVEADYARGKMKGDQTGVGSGMTDPSDIGGGISRTESWYALTTSKFEIKDTGTLRGRVGYSYGSFMPYITAGLAWARASHENSATVLSSYRDVNGSGVQIAAGNYPTLSTRKGAQTKFHFGYAVGAGIDVALSQNIFFRAEAIHSRFAGIGGAEVQINQARAAAGVKF